MRRVVAGAANRANGGRRACGGRALIVEPRTVPTALKRDPCGPAPAPRDAPDVRPVEGAEADEELALLAKALGHPARVQIVRLLVRREACVCGDIVDELPLAQSTVSQHLKVLKDAGLIRGEIDGPRVCYCVEPRALRRLKALVGSL
ncbi:regulatory protein ArsR [Anaeromyxobacter sp. Fw109-5]|nr:regulatory protein ArsR [Anaeromyxobacter sp. Fw109-5]